MINLELMSEEERNETLIAGFRYMKLHPFLPLNVYLERLEALPTIHQECVEFAPADDGNGWDVLLDLRRPDDPRYANQYGSQGSTVMPGSTLEKLLKYHENKEASFTESEFLPKNFRFCGLGVSPLLERGHEYVPIFGRVLPQKPQIVQEENEDKRVWVPINKLETLPIIPANKVYIEIARDVMIYGHPPCYREFLGVN